MSPCPSGIPRRTASSSSLTRRASACESTTSRKRARSSSPKASSSSERPSTQAFVTWGSSKTPMAMPSSFTGGMRPVSHAEALERYQALPLPDTTEEHWRFTDLRGFDPDSFEQVRGTVPGTGSGATMLDLDVAGLATIGEAGVTVERAPDGVTFTQLGEDHERLYSLVGWEEKFAA